MKYYHQKDNRWVKIKYGNKAIGSIGCLPTVMAMIHSIIDPEITPIHTAKWAQDNNFVKNGTSREFYLKYSKNYGFISHYIERNSVNEVVDALKNNKFVCISIQNHFSKILKLLNMPQSHAICAYNIDSDNNVLIVDPDDSSRLLKPIKLNYILKRVSKLDKRNTHPFVCIDLPSPEMKTTKKQR